MNTCLENDTTLRQIKTPSLNIYIRSCLWDQKHMHFSSWCSIIVVYSLNRILLNNLSTFQKWIWCHQTYLYWYLCKYKNIHVDKYWHYWYLCINLICTFNWMYLQGHRSALCEFLSCFCPFEISVPCENILSNIYVDATVPLKTSSIIRML